MSADLPTCDRYPDPVSGGVTVLMVDDHPVLRHGLGALLAAEDWVGRVVEAGTAAEGARLAVLERPRLAVVDLGLPDSRGVGLITRIRQTVPECAIVVLTMTREDAAVEACLTAGARGYLRKDTPPQGLVLALRTAAEGGTVLGPGIGVEALGRGSSRGSKAGSSRGSKGELPAPLNRLSPRDLTVLRLLGEGRGNSEIARQLQVSEKTVRNRLSTIYSVLGVADRVQAALLAREQGLVDATTSI